jgi:RimJ/RimL family protein N-acetyltransferase
MNHEVESFRTRPPSGEPVDPLPPGLRPANTIHSGQYAQLEPLDARRHAEDLYLASHSNPDDGSLWDYLPYGPYEDLEAFTAWLRSCSSTADPLFFAVRDRQSDRTGGMASFLNIHPTAGSIEIGHIWFGPALQNTAAATEALYLMIRHAMDDLGYRRMEWKCNALNQASRNAALRLGFTFEGIFYQHTIAKGRNRDTAWYSILDGEWPAIRANFQSWLDPENFHEDGRQRTSLGDLNRALQGRK